MPTMTELGVTLTAIVTPFDEDLRVDEEAFVALMRHLAEHGSDGFVVCATTGEAATLSDEEHIGLIELAVRERPVGKTIVGGTGSNDTRHAVWLTERATEAGVDATLSVTPYYNRPSRRGLLRHYREVAAATDRPVLLYNIPARTGTNIALDLLAELAQIEHIDGVKQANPQELALIDGLDLYSGDDATFAHTLDIGGAGGVLVASHIVGDEMRRMADEPERRHEIDAELRRCLRDAVPHREPDLHQGRAEPARPPRGGPEAAARGGKRRQELAEVRAMLERHGLLSPRPGPSVEEERGGHSRPQPAPASGV